MILRRYQVVIETYDRELRLEPSFLPSGSAIRYMDFVVVDDNIGFLRRYARNVYIEDRSTGEVVQRLPFGGWVTKFETEEQ